MKTRHLKGSTIIANVAAVALLLLTACAQSRAGISSGQISLSSAQSLCTNTSGQAVYGCFSIQLDTVDNIAIVTVEQLGFNAGQIPYRILARPSGDGLFYNLADNITTIAGGTFQVTSAANHKIQDYQEWRAEATVTTDANGLQTAASPGQGTSLADAILNWPDLTNSGS